MPGPFRPPYVTEGDVSDIASTAKHELGTLRFDRGRILQYIKWGSGCKPFNWVGQDLDGTVDADLANTVTLLLNQATHCPLGVSEYGGTLNSYGWITRFGPATGKTAATCSIGAPLANDGGATGILATIQSATIVQAMSGSGVLVGAASITGTHVRVKCL